MSSQPVHRYESFPGVSERADAAKELQESRAIDAAADDLVKKMSPEDKDLIRRTFDKYAGPGTPALTTADNLYALRAQAKELTESIADTQSRTTPHLDARQALRDADSLMTVGVLAGEDPLGAYRSDAVDSGDGEQEDAEDKMVRDMLGAWKRKTPERSDEADESGVHVAPELGGTDDAEDKMVRDMQSAWKGKR